MYTRYYDGYGSKPPCKSPAQSIPPPDEEEPKADLPPESVCESDTTIASVPSLSLPWNLKTDDIILLAVLFLVLSEADGDVVLPLILAFLFIGNV